MASLLGKVVVVTGASSGIGASLVKKLVTQGLKVVGLSRRLDILEDMRKELAEKPGNFYPIKCDLTIEKNILNAFVKIERDIGVINVLVNNAGIIANESIIDGQMSTFRELLDVNVLAYAVCTREACRLMRAHKVPGHVININSMAGHDAAKVKIPVSIYCACKYAVTGITESLRTELASSEPSIKVTSISPGTVRTDMIRNTFKIPNDIFESAPFLEPEDVADAVIYVLSCPPHVQINELSLKNVKEP